MTREQALSLAAAISQAETALRIFAAHEPPPELVFARYSAQQALEHLSDLLASLPDPDYTAVARDLDRLRRAGTGNELPMDVVPLIPRRGTPEASRTTEEPPRDRC